MKRELFLMTICLIMAILPSCQTMHKSSFIVPQYTFHRNSTALHVIGTLHRLPPIACNNRELQRAFASQLAQTDLVLFEADPNSYTPQIRKEIDKMLYPAKGSIGDFAEALPDSEKADFYANLQNFAFLENPDNRQKFLKHSPFTASSFFMPFENEHLGISANNSIEEMIKDIADREQIPYTGLQSPIYSLLLYLSFPQEYFFDQLRRKVANPLDEKIYIKSIEVCLDAWWQNYRNRDFQLKPEKIAAEIQGIQATGSDSMMQAELNNLIYLKREEHWVARIDSIQKSNPLIDDISVAVGYLHLNPRVSSFIDLLEQDGWELKSSTMQIDVIYDCVGGDGLEEVG